MRKEGVPPDTITYNSLLKAAGVAGLLGEARCLYAELRHAGLRPTTFTYAALFNAAARARGGDAAWLLEVRARWEGLGGGREGICCYLGCCHSRRAVAQHMLGLLLIKSCCPLLPAPSPPCPADL